MVDGGEHLENDLSPFSINWYMAFAEEVLERYMELPEQEQERLASESLIVAVVSAKIATESSQFHDLAPWPDGPQLGPQPMADLPEIVLQAMLQKYRDEIADLKKDVNSYYDKYRKSQSEAAAQISILTAKLSKAQLKL